MKTFVSTTLPLLLLISSTVSLAANTSPGGVIHFRGAIVEDPCNIARTADNVAFNCYRNGVMKTSVYSLEQAEKGVKGNNAIAAVKMDYLNPQKTMAVLRVDYQ